MIAAEPAERAVEAQRVVGTHFATSGKQRLPEASLGVTQTAEPVADHMHAHAGFGAFEFLVNIFIEFVRIDFWCLRHGCTS